MKRALTKCENANTRTVEQRCWLGHEAVLHLRVSADDKFETGLRRCGGEKRQSGKISLAVEGSSER